MPITTTGLIQFVLGNASPRIRWQATFELCSGRCLLQKLSYFTIQYRRCNRRLRILRNTLNSLNVKFVWEGKYRHDKHEREVTSYSSSTRRRFRESCQRCVSLSLLLDLLRARIYRFVSRIHSELTQDFLQDMFTLIQERRQMPSGTPSGKSSSSKGKGKKRSKTKGVPAKSSLPMNESSSVVGKDEM